MHTSSELSICRQDSLISFSSDCLNNNNNDENENDIKADLSDIDSQLLLLSSSIIMTSSSSTVEQTQTQNTQNNTSQEISSSPVQLEKFSSDCKHDMLIVLQEVGPAKRRLLWKMHDLFHRVSCDIASGKSPSITLKLSQSKSIRLHFSKINKKKKKKSGEKGFAIVMRLLQIMHDLMSKNVYATKRDIFYRDVDLFSSQRVSDKYIDYICKHFQVDRFTLNVLSSGKGLIAGPIEVEFKNTNQPVVSLNGCDSGGHLVPQTELISKISVCDEVKFILVVEKAAIFTHLLSAKVQAKLGPMILLTGKGYPDEQTRRFLYMLRESTQVPIFGLMDNDPYGVHILSQYQTGKYAVTNIEWIGLKCTDWTQFNLPDESLLPLSPYDRKRGLTMLKSCVSNDVKRELQRTLKYGKKAELQALTMYDSNFLIASYLPAKLETVFARGKTTESTKSNEEEIVRDSLPDARDRSFTRAPILETATGDDISSFQ